LKNSAKTRIASFEIQRIKLKPKPEESLTQRIKKKFLTVKTWIEDSLKNKDSDKTNSYQGFCFW